MTTTNTKENDKNKHIFEFAFSMALRDATLQRSYGEKGVNKPKKENCSGAIDAIRGFLEKILNGDYKDQEDYNNKFFEIANNVKKDVNENCQSEYFKFGNAQKLINMTIKYMYILTYNNDKQKANFKCCHCPMDKKMLTHVWEEKEENIKMDYGFTKGNWIETSWGKEEEPNINNCDETNNRYIVFQKFISELANENKMSPIEYDYKIWNEPTQH